VVGVISLTEARSSTIIAVGISVTTIPTASDIGVSVAFGSWTEAWGSAVQLALNVSVLTAVATLGASGSAGSLAASDPPQLHSASRLGRNGSDRPNSASSSGHHPQRMMRRGVKSATLLMSQISERVAVNCSWMSPTEGSVSS
jgi:hypothetical protein